MGTRSLTHVQGTDGSTLVTIYRQYDGYFTGHGNDLFEIGNGMRIVNGYTPEDQTGRVANGAECFAAQLVMELKLLMRQQQIDSRKRFPDHHKNETFEPSAVNALGGIYIYPAGSVDVGEEYTYFLRESHGALHLVASCYDDVMFSGPISMFGPELQESLSQEGASPFIVTEEEDTAPPAHDRTLHYRSETDEHKVHATTLFASGDVLCTCTGFQMRRACKHVRWARTGKASTAGPVTQEAST